MTPAIEPPSLDKELGMEVYLTDVEGIGGTIKKRYDDFLVEEVLRGFGKAGSHIKGSRGDGHLLCVVSRRGWETLHLVSELAKRLRIPRRCVSSAGFKDKRAYVKQFISIEGVDPVRVEGLRFNGVEVSPRGFIDEPLSSKLLMGNRFTIIVRNPSLELDKAQGVLAHMHSVMKGLGGFPNFYGYQRFGSARPVTHLVGRLMIRRRFEEAIRIYLGFAGSRECEEARVARRAYIEGGRLEEAYRLFPRKFIYERIILKRLMKFPEDYLGAFRALPLGLRRLFINAYQGYLFNKLLSLRVLEGLPLGRALKGDWVLYLTPEGFDASSPIRAAGSSMDRLNRLLREGKARIAIPILGYLSELSEGEMGLLERRVLDEEEIKSLKSFYIGALPEASGEGGLRPILAPIKSFSFETLSEGVRFTFFLYKECYATVLLREFMKPRDPVTAGF